jgi:uncharacterized membrane protein
MSTDSSSAADAQGKPSLRQYEQTAHALGWCSLALGLAQMAAPATVANLTGIQADKGQCALLRSPAYGMREVAAGIGLLTQPDKSSWLWTRVVGDVIDIGTLIAALGSPRNDRKRVVASLTAVLGITALDVICAQKLTGAAARDAAESEGTSRICQSIWINKSPAEAYTFWRRFENLPLFMLHLESVQMIDENISRWRAAGPLGQSYEWKARLEQDEPNRRITWKSLEDSEIHNSGMVFFEEGPGRRGVIVHVDISYHPPAGHAGEVVAKLFGAHPERMIANDLRAFKQTLETNEVIYSDASIHPFLHPARPSRDTGHAA